MQRLIKIRVLFIFLVVLFCANTGMSQDLQQQKQHLRNRISEIDAKLNSSPTADEYNKLIKEREKLVAEIKDIETKLMADVEAMKKINAVKKAYNDGNNAYKLGQYQQAVTSYDKAISMDSTFFKAYYGKGLALKKLRKYAEATKAYQGAIRQNPSYSLAYIALGKIFSQRGMPDKAIETYTKAIEYDPTSAKLCYELGAVYQNRKKNYKKAVENFTKATQINPEYDLAFYSLGVSLTELNRLDEAVVALENALAVTKRKRWADPHYRLSVVFNKKGNFSKALKSAEQALAIKKNFAPAAYEAGKACKSLGRFNAAIGYFDIVAKDRQWRRTAEYEIDLIKNRDKYGGNN